MGFKAASTLDSMVGYLDEKYRDIGWASAKLDDVLNYLPARLTGLLMCAAAFLTGMDGRSALRVMRRDHANHLSPNCAWPESAAAGVMQTHSACADARREAIVTHLALMGAPRCLLQAVYDSVTTEAAVGLIRAAGMDEVWNRLAQAAKRYCTLRVRGQIEIEIVFTGSAGEMLGGTVEP